MELHTSGGSLNLSDLSGNIKANTSGGSVDGDRIDGELYAHTSGGSVHLNNLTCSVETSTSGGSIDVEIVKLGKFVKSRKFRWQHFITDSKREEAWILTYVAIK